MRAGFLPEENYLYDLGIRSDGDDQQAVARMPIRPELRNRWGVVHAGLFVVLVDSVTGRLAVRAARPDLVATSHISLQTAGSASRGELVAQAHVLRRSRSSVALAVDLEECEDEARPGRPVASGCVTFAVLPNALSPEVAQAIADFAERPVELGRSEATLGAPYLSRIGLRVVDAEAGVVELPLSPYVQNHLQALQGGIVATLMQAAAEESAAAACAEPRVATDLSVQYLALGRTGPFRTRARVLRHSRHGAALRIELRDAGAGDRILALAGVHCEPPPGL